MSLGPDARRYIHAAMGHPVPRPFHLRIGLPWLCGTKGMRWSIVWIASWPIAALGMFAWRAPIDGWQIALAATAILLALPGILGPASVIPVGVDLPATALALLGVALISDGHPARIVAGVLTICLAASIKETAPIWAALWVWSPWPLIALVVPLIVALVRKPGPDPLGAQFQDIADHPIRTAWEHHQGRWRDGWLMVSTWGIGIAALVEPDWRLLVVLVVAHLQLLVATDTVRLVQHAAGPAVAVAAAQVIPTQWLVLAIVAHTVWFRVPERV
jgi:hypothetical protein